MGMGMGMEMEMEMGMETGMEMEIVISLNPYDFCACFRSRTKRALSYSRVIMQGYVWRFGLRLCTVLAFH